jgi:glycosyltransferase involved in cell wall biosynthesis
VLSVIIPTYNRASVLARAVDSVLAQTCPPDEIIVVDDGSTDHTGDVLAAYGRRLSVIRQDNGGVSRARNAGIRAASGDLIALLDSDDAWRPKKLEHQMAALTARPDLPLCHTDEIWIRYGVRVNPMQKHQKRGGDIFPDCLPICVISPSSVVLRRAIFDEVGLFDETLPACEDYDLWLRIAYQHEVLFLEEPLLIKYGGHADQLSRQYWGLDRFRVQALVKLLETAALTAAQRRQTCRELRRKCAILANGSRKREKFDEFAHYTNLPARYCDDFPS